MIKHKPKVGQIKKKTERIINYFDEHPNDGRFELESSEARKGSNSPSDPKIEIKNRKSPKSNSNLHMTVQNFNQILEKNLDLRNQSSYHLIKDKMSRTSYYPKEDTSIMYHKNMGYSP